MNTVILKISLGLAFCVLVFLALGPWMDKFYTSSTPLIANDPVLDSLKYEISELKVKAEDLKDTIFGLRVDKGHSEVELNKSKSQIDVLTSKYNEAKKKKDTVRIIVIADSFINEVNESYIPLSEYVIRRSEVIDSMQLVQLNIMDSIDVSNTNIRNKLTHDLFSELTNNAVLRDKQSKQKKKPLIAAVLGFIAGIFSVLIIK